MALRDSAIRVKRRPPPALRKHRKLEVLHFEAKHANDGTHSESLRDSYRVPTHVVRLLHEVAPTLIVIVVTVLAVDFESTVREDPAKERRGELVVSEGERAVGAILVLQRHEQIGEGWTTLTPQSMR